MTTKKTAMEKREANSCDNDGGDDDEDDEISHNLLDCQISISYYNGIINTATNLHSLLPVIAFFVLPPSIFLLISRQNGSRIKN